MMFFDRRRPSRLRDDIKPRDLAAICSIIQIRHLAKAIDAKNHVFFWILVLVGSVVGFAYQSSILYQEYKQHHVVTEVTVNLNFCYCFFIQIFIRIQHDFHECAGSLNGQLNR